jgi:hypothetical protein
LGHIFSQLIANFLKFLKLVLRKVQVLLFLAQSLAVMDLFLLYFIILDILLKSTFRF